MYADLVDVDGVGSGREDEGRLHGLGVAPRLLRQLRLYQDRENRKTVSAIQVSNARFAVSINTK